MTGMCFKVALCFSVVAMFVGGCTGPWWQGEPQAITLDTSGVAAKVDYNELAVVLKETASKDGAVWAKDMDAVVDRLDAQLKRMAVAGPTVAPHLFPTPQGRLAYWYNARAAWVLKLLVNYREGDVSVGRFRRTPVPVDGRTMTLEDVDALLLDQFGWQALVAAPGVSSSRAALPSEPVEVKETADLIVRRFNDFIDDEARFEIDIPGRRICVPPVLWRFRAKLIADHNRTYRTRGATLATALLAQTSGSAHRRLQDAVGYKCIRAEAGKIPSPKADED
jgi:hypothetical protein